MAPVGPPHREAVPLRKTSFFHMSVPVTSCQVVEILWMSLEGAKSADVTPEEVEYVIEIPAFTTDNCPAGSTLNSGEWIQALVA